MRPRGASSVVMLRRWSAISVFSQWWVGKRLAPFVVWPSMLVSVGRRFERIAGFCRRTRGGFVRATT